MDKNARNAGPSTHLVYGQYGSYPVDYVTRNRQFKDDTDGDYIMLADGMGLIGEDLANKIHQDDDAISCGIRFIIGVAVAILVAIVVLSWAL